MAREYLGTSATFPLRLIDGAMGTIGGLDLINQSILTILNTKQGTEFFLPELGSRLHELTFEPNDEVLKDFIRLFIFEALSAWEKRVQFISVDFEKPTEDSLNCKINYRILQSNEIESFVYPFYRTLIH